MGVTGTGAPRGEHGLLNTLPLRLPNTRASGCSSRGWERGQRGRGLQGASLQDPLPSRRLWIRATASLGLGALKDKALVHRDGDRNVAAGGWALSGLSVGLCLGSGHDLSRDRAPLQALAPRTAESLPKSLSLCPSSHRALFLSKANEPFFLKNVTATTTTKYGKIITLLRFLVHVVNGVKEVKGD